MGNGRSARGNLKKCARGHRYYKSSDCPVCPLCENELKAMEQMQALSAPARRALHNAGIKTPSQLSKFTVTEILRLHGMGPSSIPKLKTVLKSEGLSFKAE